jgi:hypothetical protein
MLEATAEDRFGAKAGVSARLYAIPDYHVERHPRTRLGVGAG